MTSSAGGGHRYDLPDGFELADPEDVDKEAVMALGDCPNCGENSLATARVENAEYVVECSSCDHDKRGPVVINEEGDEIVKFDAELSEEVTA